MKIEDLRVGHWIVGKGKNIPWQITKEDLITMLEKDDLSGYEFVPITEERLLKCGFEDSTGGWGGSQGCDKHFIFNKFEIQTYDSDNFWHIKNNFDIKFNFIHELQDLYKSLKKQELDFDADFNSILINR